MNGKNSMKRLYNKATAWRSKFAGRKFWQYVSESIWAYGAGVMAARPVP